MNFSQNLSLVEPSVELILEDDPFKMIELAGRVCYKSEDKISEGSSKRFVHNVIEHKHLAMIEHASLVFQLVLSSDSYDYIDYLLSNNFFRLTLELVKNRVLISANIRAILEREIDDPIYRATIQRYPEFAVEVGDPEFTETEVNIVDIKSFKDLTYNEFLNHFTLSLRFITDRGVSHEIVRHRLFSFAQESTRYCNYSKDKFGGHVTFCRPVNYPSWSESKQKKFDEVLEFVDQAYQYLTSGEDALTPQDARSVLTTCTKTEIVVSGPAFEWAHFFNLRSLGTTGKPHPDMKFVADRARILVNQYVESLGYDETYQF